MTIREVFIGTWFPRTALHLREIEQVLRGEHLQHHPREVPGLVGALAVTRVEMHEGTFRTLMATSRDLTISLTEDGIILLSTAEPQLVRARSRLTEYYEGKLSPLLDAIFRRGMPLPKELANIRTILPFFVYTTGGSRVEAARLAQRQGGGSVFPVTLGHLAMFPGTAITVLHVLDPRAVRLLPLPVPEFVQYMTLFREFENQLHTYLQLHRDIWESIDAVVEANRLQYRDLTRVRDRLSSQRKTIGFVRARIAQMGDVLTARARYIHDKNFEASLGRLWLDRFPSLTSAQRYIAHLWEVTDRYAEGTEGLVRLIYDENLRREVVILNIIVFATLLTSYFGMNVPLPWEDRWIERWPSTVVVSVLLLVLGIGGYLFLRQQVLNRHFAIRELVRNLPSGGQPTQGPRGTARRSTVSPILPKKTPTR